jgi:hypothetical protein
MLKPVTLMMMILALQSTSAFAGEKCPDGKKCEEPPRQVCFNMLCTYQSDDPHARYQLCHTAARFVKWVTNEGEEIFDDSEHPFNPEFEVECDEDLLFNEGARRFTDRLGTRIQSQTGPYPATLLPRGALHDGHRYEISTLEMGDEILRGYCYLYTGPQ